MFNPSDLASLNNILGVKTFEKIKPAENQRVLRSKSGDGGITTFIPHWFAVLWKSGEYTLLNVHSISLYIVAFYLFLGKLLGKLFLIRWDETCFIPLFFV